MAPPPEAHLSGSIRRDAAWLGAMAALGAGWVAISAVLGTITGHHQADGIVGIVLGLYVSSFPARHFVDLLMYSKIEGARFPTRRTLGWWIALNAGVLLAGFLTIVFAAARFTAAPARG